MAAFFVFRKSTPTPKTDTNNHPQPRALLMADLNIDLCQTFSENLELLFLINFNFEARVGEKNINFSLKVARPMGKLLRNDKPTNAVFYAK